MKMKQPDQSGAFTEGDLLAELAAGLAAERPVKPQGAVTIADLVRATGLPETTAKRHVTAQVAAGVLELVPGRPADNKVYEPTTGRMVRAWQRPGGR